MKFAELRQFLRESEETKGLRKIGPEVVRLIAELKKKIGCPLHWFSTTKRDHQILKERTYAITALLGVEVWGDIARHISQYPEVGGIFPLENPGRYPERQIYDPKKLEPMIQRQVNDAFSSDGVAGVFEICGMSYFHMLEYRCRISMHNMMNETHPLFLHVTELERLLNIPNNPAVICRKDIPTQPGMPLSVQNISMNLLEAARVIFDLYTVIFKHIEGLDEKHQQIFLSKRGQETVRKQIEEYVKALGHIHADTFEQFLLVLTGKNSTTGKPLCDLFEIKIEDELPILYLSDKPLAGFSDILKTTKFRNMNMSGCPMGFVTREGGDESILDESVQQTINFIEQLSIPAIRKGYGVQN